MRSLITKGHDWARRHAKELDRGLFVLAACLLPCALFLCFFTPDVLNPTRIGWLFHHDWGQHVLGWHALRNVPWSPTFYYQDLLAHPTGLSIIYTDSNPPLAYFFKLLDPILPANFQYIGPWFFLCIGLQLFTAYHLVRPFAPGKWTALLGALVLSALPSLYYRMRHDTLMAHFFILWALYAFFHIKDDSQRRLHFMANLFLCGMIHPYILFMTAAIWCGDWLRSFGQWWPIRHKAPLWPLLKNAAMVLGSSFIGMGLVGTYAAGQSIGAGGYGYFSMGLDALINPVRPEFSNILKAWHQDGGQAFEGWQYLGFGLLMLLALSVFFWWQRPEVRRTKPYFQSLKPLILPCLGLFLVAISHHVQSFDITLFRLELPEPILDILAILRASGRFFWPISYLMLLSALVVLFALPRRTVLITLSVIGALQIIDLWGFADSMRKATQSASSPVIYRLTPDPAWDGMMKHAKTVHFYPAQVHHNQKLFYELAWRSVSHGIPVNTMYAARENTHQIAIENKAQDEFLRGNLRDDQLYVFLKQCHAPRSVQNRLREVDGVWIIPPKGYDPSALNRPNWTPISPKIRFGWLDQGGCLLDDQWTRPAYDGVWTTSGSASLTIPMQAVQFESVNPRRFSMMVDIEVPDSGIDDVPVSIIINRRKIETIIVSDRQGRYRLTLPRSFLNARSLLVEFDLEGASSRRLADREQRRLTGKGAPLTEDPAAGRRTQIKLKSLDLIASE
jgi:hypothetical protein